MTLSPSHSLLTTNHLSHSPRMRLTIREQDTLIHTITIPTTKSTPAPSYYTISQLSRTQPTSSQSLYHHTNICISSISSGYVMFEGACYEKTTRSQLKHENTSMYKHATTVCTITNRPWPHPDTGYHIPPHEQSRPTLKRFIFTLYIDTPHIHYITCKLSRTSLVHHVSTPSVLPPEILCDRATAVCLRSIDRHFI